jgi:hypothetical protein
VSGPAPLAEIPARVAAVRRRIEAAAGRAGRDAAGVTLIAACKTVDLERVRCALEHGVGELGENRVQEAEEKIRALGPGPRWHLIGHLQSNKAARAAAIFDWVHGVDSVALGEKIDRSARERGRAVQILLQVNLSGEATKSGVREEEAEGIARRLAELKSARLRGLMTIPALSPDPERARPAFRRLRGLLESINRAAALPQPLDVLSMGMTEDFEVAIEEGATHIRVGRALFGDRPGAPGAPRPVD